MKKKNRTVLRLYQRNSLTIIKLTKKTLILHKHKNTDSYFIKPSKTLTIPRKGWHFLERLTNRVYITTETVYSSSFGELFLFTSDLIQFTVSFFIWFRCAFSRSDAAREVSANIIHFFFLAHIIVVFPTSSLFACRVLKFVYTILGYDTL